MLSVKQGNIKYYFWVFGMTQPGIEPRSPRPLANTLPIRLKNVLFLTRNKKDISINQVWSVQHVLFISIKYIIFAFIIFTQPLRSGKIWHKVNF